MHSGDSSVCSESELSGSNIPGPPPSPPVWSDSFGGHRGRSSGLAVLPGIPWLSLGHGVTRAAQEGDVYSGRYIYIIYILLIC